MPGSPFLFWSNMQLALPIITKNVTQDSAAKRKLEAQLAVGADKEARIIEHVSSMLINDAWAVPREMDFTWDRGGVLVKPHPSKDWFNIHPHAFAQMCGTLEYPQVYVRKLREGLANIPLIKSRQKLVDDLLWHAHNAQLKNKAGADARYLFRSVNGELRGFLSASYNVNLASKPLMRSFLNSIHAAGLRVIDAVAAPVRVSVKAAMPVVFTPVPGEHVAIGACWSNSDFGGGRMSVSMFMHRISSGTTAVLDTSISAVHLGPIITDSEFRPDEEAAKAELTAQKLNIAKAVNDMMHPDNVDRLMNVIALAAAEEIPWARLRNELGRLLQKQEIQKLDELLKKGSGYEELPPVRFDDEDEGDLAVSRWWAANAVGRLANGEDDVERARDLQNIAGELLGKTKGLKK